MTPSYFYSTIYTFTVINSLHKWLLQLLNFSFNSGVYALMYKILISFYTVNTFLEATKVFFYNLTQCRINSIIFRIFISVHLWVLYHKNTNPIWNKNSLIKSIKLKYTAFIKYAWGWTSLAIFIVVYLNSFQFHVFFSDKNCNENCFLAFSSFFLISQ